MSIYICVCLGAAAVSLLATPLVAGIAKARGLVDQPGVRKVHKSAVPRIGGAAIFLATLVSLVPALVWDSLSGKTFHGIHTQMMVLLSASAFVFVVGFIDDLHSVSAKVKFLALVGASLAVCLSGARIQRITIDGLFSLQLGWASWPMTVLWIVCLTVAMNFIDGLDGLAAGIATIVCGTIAVLAFHSGQPATAAVMLAIVGSLIGFLFFNFNPAKIFMGDCGSMFLGFIIGAGSVVCSSKTSAIVGLALPTLAMGVPILDAILTIIRRGILDRRSIFSAERGHIHHRLLDSGLRHRQAVLLIHGATLVAAATGMLLLVTGCIGSLVVIAGVLTFLLVLFHSAGSTRLGETLAATKRNLRIKRYARLDGSHFEHAQLAMREAGTFDDWWNVICKLAEAMGFERITLLLQDREGIHYHRSWQRTSDGMPPAEVVNVRIPLRGIWGGLARIEGTLRADTYEAAGRRVMLFGRLIDEHEADTALKLTRLLSTLGPRSSPEAAPMARIARARLVAEPLISATG